MEIFFRTWMEFCSFANPKGCCPQMLLYANRLMMIMMCGFLNCGIGRKNKRIASGKSAIGTVAVAEKHKIAIMKTKDDSTRERRIYRVTLTGSVVNVLLLLLKFAAGILGHSAAMVADAVHSLSDFLTDIVVLVMVRLSGRPADSDHKYGHGKFETLATAIIGIALIVVAVMLGWGGVGKIVAFLRGEQLVAPGRIALAAALASVVLKEWVFRITRRVAREVGSQALEANAWHHRSDALSSIATAVGVGGAILLGNRWAVLDPIAAVIVSVLILVTAAELLRPALGELLEESLPAETESRILNIVSADPIVSDIHNLRTRRIGSIIAIEMHLRMPGHMPLCEAHRHASDIEEALRREFGADTYIMLHLEPMK